MKKFIFGFLGGLIVASIPATFAFSYIFPDVAEGQWYSGAIRSLHTKGIIEGHPDGTFGVGENVTREELAVMLDRFSRYVDEKIAATITWKPYSNQKFGFSVSVPEKVYQDNGRVYQNDDKEEAWVPLNIYEDEKNVYFSTHTLEETLQKMWSEFKVGGGKMENRDGILPFLESYYGVKGCKIELVKNEDSGFYRVWVSSQDPTLMPDDPMSCFIGGKVTTMYDELSEKLITYQVADQFFYGPGEDKFIESLRFTP